MTALALAIVVPFVLLVIVMFAVTLWECFKIDRAEQRVSSVHGVDELSPRLAPPNRGRRGAGRRHGMPAPRVVERCRHAHPAGKGGR